MNATGTITRLAKSRDTADDCRDGRTGVLVETCNHDGSARPLSFDPYGARRNRLFGSDGLWDPNRRFADHPARFRNGARFVSYDSFEADPSAPAGLHKYLYGNANSTGATDPRGTNPISAAAATAPSQIATTLPASTTGPATRAAVRLKSRFWHVGFTRFDGPIVQIRADYNMEYDAVAQRLTATLYIDYNPTLDAILRVKQDHAIWEKNFVDVFNRAQPGANPPYNYWQIAGTVGDPITLEFKIVGRMAMGQLGGSYNHVNIDMDTGRPSYWSWSLGWPGWSDLSPAHEFGHRLGLLDEYKDTLIYPHHTDPSDCATALMCHGYQVKARYVQDIVDHAEVAVHLGGGPYIVVQ